MACARGRRRLVRVAACAALSLLWLHPAVAAGATHRVAIQGLKYVPETLTVHPGDTIVWVNDDPFPHTVTASGFFESRSIEAGKSWRWVARRAGAYPYVCTLHSNMKGTLRVE
jgi:plastocyanin